MDTYIIGNFVPQKDKSPNELMVPTTAVHGWLNQCTNVSCSYRFCSLVQCTCLGDTQSSLCVSV